MPANMHANMTEPRALGAGGRAEVESYRYFEVFFGGGCLGGVVGG